MILVLSLAVLFGFAACDNSSSTPDDDQTTTTDVSDLVVKTVVDDILSASGDFDSKAKGIEASITDLLGAAAANSETELIDRTGYDVTVSKSDITTITIKKTIAEAIGETYPVKDVTLVVNGVDVSGDTGKGTSAAPYKVQLNDFTYTYNTYVDGVTSTITAASGSFSGYFAGSAVASVVVDETEVTSYKVTSSDVKVVLGKDATTMSLKVGDDTATATRLFDMVTKDYGTLTYATYVSGQDSTFEGEIDTWTKALIADSGLLAKLATFNPASDSAIKVAYSTTDGGSITITYTATADTQLVGDGSTKKTFTLAEGDVLTVVLAGKSGTTATDSAFTPVTASIKGSFETTDTTAPSFETIDVDIVVDLDAVATPIANPSAYDCYKGLTLDDTKIDGSVSASVPYGPAIEAAENTAGYALVSNTVVKAY